LPGVSDIAQDIVYAVRKTGGLEGEVWLVAVEAFVADEVGFIEGVENLHQVTDFNL